MVGISTSHQHCHKQSQPLQHACVAQGCLVIAILLRVQEAAGADCVGCALQVKALHEGLPEQLLQGILLGLRDPCSLELSQLQADIESALYELTPRNNSEDEEDDSGESDSDEFLYL